MVLGANKKQPLVLFLAALMLVFFILITYFYWVPDSLISLVPGNALSYTHLNLSKFHYSGYLSQKWIRNHQSLVKDFFQERSMPSDFLDFIEEIAFFTLPPEKDNNLPSMNLLFQSKDLKKEDFQEFFKEDWVEEMAPHIFLVSKEKKDFTKKEGFLSQDSSFRFINPFQQEVVLAPGYFDLNLVSLYLPVRERGLAKNSELKEFEIIYSLKEKDLFFQIESSSDFIVLVNNFNSEDLWNLKNEFKFVFSFPDQTSLENLRQKISTYLAWGSPRERQIVLPDNTSFTEIVINPEKFAFEEKDSIYYWQSPSLEGDQEFSQFPLVEFAFFQEKGYVYFSNDFSFLKEIKNRQQQGEEKQEFLLIELNNPWFQSLVLSFQDNKIVGHLEEN
ncbi:hypothetical protein K9K85_00310 [Patescibacteria group bacterium]|nr:hypothetical protein [Patescibacteria group bacterium]